MSLKIPSIGQDISQAFPQSDLILAIVGLFPEIFLLRHIVAGIA